MTKTELIKKLTDIEWEDFEVKESKSELPKIYGRPSVHFPIQQEGGLFWE